jgi:hypothetical protein
VEAFRAAGLQPAGDTGSFVQRWEYVKSSLQTDATVASYGEGDDGVALTLGEDFFLIPGKAERVRAELLYAGSIEALIDGSGPDGEGRVLLVTTPASLGPELLVAVRNAGESGAAALLMVLDPNLPANVVGMVQDQIARSGLPAQAVPALGVSWDVGVALSAAAGFDLEALAAEESIASALPGAHLPVTIEAPMTRETSRPPNVVGLVPGSDPELASEYVVLSAHFDHVGIGEPNAAGDSIYNGADDNASGTAVLIEVAQAFQAMTTGPARSVLFLAVSGEEKGLLGAAHFADHPTVPADAIVANINLDMIGRNAPDTVIAVGMEYTSLGETARHVTEHHPELGLTVAPDPNPEEQAFFRSDHLVFVKQEIPAIFLTTWLHDDYHQPSDEAAAIDPDKAARIARLTFLLAWHAANDPEAPRWNDGALEKVREILKTSPL